MATLNAEELQRVLRVHVLPYAEVDPPDAKDTKPTWLYAHFPVDAAMTIVTKFVTDELPDLLRRVGLRIEGVMVEGGHIRGHVQVVHAGPYQQAVDGTAPPAGATPAEAVATPAVPEIRADYYVRIVDPLTQKPADEAISGLQDALRVALRFVPDGQLDAFWLAVSARLPDAA